MQKFIIVVHLMIVCALVGFVLLQKSEGGGFVGSTGGFLTSRGSWNLLTRTTAILAAAFFATSLMLSIIAGWSRNPGSILQPTAGAPGAPASGSPAGGAPSGGAPSSSGGGGLLDQLRQQEQAPAGPQVPQSK